MAGGSNALKRVGTEGERVSIVQWTTYRTGSAVRTDAEASNGMGEIVYPRCIKETGTELYPECVFYEGYPEYVVKMQVCTQQVLYM